MNTVFIVVNYNGEKYLEKCLNFILSQNYKKFKILVIDNNSTDKSKEILKKMVDENSKIDVLFNEENVGFVKAVNLGVDVTTSPLIALINNDAFIRNDWLENMICEVKKDLRAGIFASKIYLLNGLINSAGHSIFKGLIVMDRGYFERDSGQYDKPCYVAGACAAAALYRRRVFEDIGLFDESYFMYNDDVDFSLRAILYGWKIKFVPNAIAYHVHSASTGVLSDFSLYHNNRNWVWSVLKNIPRRVLIKEFPFFILRNLAFVCHFCLQGKWIALKSKIDAVKEIRKILKKRREIQKNARYDKFEEYINGFGWRELKNVWISQRKRRNMGSNEVRI